MVLLACHLASIWRMDMTYFCALKNLRAELFTSVQWSHGISVQMTAPLAGCNPNQQTSSVTCSLGHAQASSTVCFVCNFLQCRTLHHGLSCAGGLVLFYNQKRYGIRLPSVVCEYKWSVSPRVEPLLILLSNDAPWWQ